MLARVSLLMNALVVHTGESRTIEEMDVVHVPLLSHALLSMMAGKPCTPATAVQLRRDFVCLATLCGNDFVAPLPCYEVESNGFAALLRAYRCAAVSLVYQS